MFHLSTTGHSGFTAADSHKNLVVLGDSGDTLTLIDYTSAGAAWELADSDKALNGSSGGYDFYNLVDGDGDVLASVAVDSDMSVVI